MYIDYLIETPFSETLQIVKSGIGFAYPCAAVAVGVGHRVYLREFSGQRQINPLPLDLTENTLFDIASLSKLTATAMIALRFVEGGMLCIDDNIGKFLDYTGNFSDCTVKHLMTHTSGLTAGLPLFSMQHKNNDVLFTILDSDRCCKAGEEVIYSCMGYIVLQRILENISGKNLSQLAYEFVFSPLGMKNACYNPRYDKSNVNRTPVAASEFYSHSKEWATGHVHDENAYYLGGISGNAGVFASLDDMIAFAGMCSSEGISKSGELYLSKDIFNLAIRDFTPDKKESRGLGFQLKGNQPSLMGELMSRGSYGHTGFTGTSLYVDKATGLWGVLLTNAVHFGRENRSAYFSLRRSFYDSMITEYEKLRKEGRL